MIAIIVGIAILCGLFGLLTCLCCCCFRGRRSTRPSKNPNYKNPPGGIGAGAPVFQPWAGAYRGVHDPTSAPAEGGAVPLEDIEAHHSYPQYQGDSQSSRLSNPFRDSYRPPSYAPPLGPPPPDAGTGAGAGAAHSRVPSAASPTGFHDPFSDANGPPPRYQNY